eukprot:scaffold80056_cov30-Tisochrysis_lutea.AAC.4
MQNYLGLGVDAKVSAPSWPAQRSRDRVVPMRCYESGPSLLMEGVRLPRTSLANGSAPDLHPRARMDWPAPRRNLAA